jgi:Fe-S-cluster-containing hydrogenase component 2
MVKVSPDIEMIQEIANYLGVDAGSKEKQIARLACAGGTHVAYTRATYEGLKTCRAAALISGGGKGCTWGCLGLADCEFVCDFDAISMNSHSLPVVDADKCTACNDCCEVCPKNLFSLQSINNKLWIACKNLDIGNEAEANCEVVCTACGRCAVDAIDGLIEIKNNLAEINYDINNLQSQLKKSKVAIERCPTGAIVWLDKDNISKGYKAKKIIRKEALPIPLTNI